MNKNKINFKIIKWRIKKMKFKNNSHQMLKNNKKKMNKIMKLFYEIIN